MRTEITNPLAEHRTFKRTFLVQTEVTVTFTPELSSDEFVKRMVPYLKAVFSLDVKDKPDDRTNHIELKSRESQKRYIFDVKYAKFLVGAENYESFRLTALPMLAQVHKFVANVAQVDTIEQLQIVKVNRWPFDTDDAFSNYPKMMGYVFKENHLEDMPVNNLKEKQEPFRLTRSGHFEPKDGLTLDAELLVEVKAKEKVELGLALRGVATNVKNDRLCSTAVELNDIVYQGFTESVSENILDLMSREE